VCSSDLLSAVYSGHFRDGDKLANILLEDG